MLAGKLVVYDQAHLSTDQATSGSPPETTSVPNLEQPKSYAEITGQELSTGPTSTGLEESLAKLTTSSSEISQGQAVSETRKETGGQLAAAAYKVAGNAALKVCAAADGTSVVVMFEPTLVVLALAEEQRKRLLYIK